MNSTIVSSAPNGTQVSKLSIPWATSRCVSLALSGGHVSGSYEAGAYEAMHAAGYTIDRVSGAAIGAVNAAILAGNPPQRRIEKLREFWYQTTMWTLASDLAREICNQQAARTGMMNRPGLCLPPSMDFLSPLPGAPVEIGGFNARRLQTVLPHVVDFDYLNQAELPLVVCSVDLHSGEAVYFDSLVQAIEPKHVLASMGLMPGFAPVEIGGRLLAHPGMLCNLPLDPLLREPLPGDHVCFAVDMFDARSSRPFSRDMALERVRDISFASQSLRTVAAFRREYRLRHLLAQQADLTRAAPDGGPCERQHAVEDGKHGQTQVVLLACQLPVHEAIADARQFSVTYISERWNAGQQDMQLAVSALEGGRATTRDPGFSFYDCRRCSMARRQDSA